MEYIDLYDYQRQKNGRVIRRGDPIHEGEYYLVAQALVFDEENRLLIQQRSADKRGWPNLWDITAGGGVQSGETTQETAGRELAEEMGIEHSFLGTRPYVTANFEGGFTDVYMTRIPLKLAQLTLQKEEVQDARWATREEVLAMLADGRFVAYHPGWINYLFDLAENRLQYGSFRMGSAGPGKQRPQITYENTLRAIFLRRINRFTAEVMVDGIRVCAHVKNTGRLGELLLAGAEVTLQRMDNPNRKTAYDLISVYKEELAWVNIDSLAPNELMKQELEGQNYDLVKPEYTYGDSRFDFYMEKGCERYLTEVKGCTLAYDTVRGIGMFPDAPTERGVKHLHELATAARDGYHCTIAFVIQMNGIRTVIPNDETQPEFGRALTEAHAAGVKIRYYSTRVEDNRITLEGFTSFADV